MIIYTVFLTFEVNLFEKSQWWIFPIHYSRLLPDKWNKWTAIIVSSTFRAARELSEQFERSLMYNKNRKDPRFDPCETPQLGFRVLLRSKLTENAFWTRPERVPNCVRIAFQMRSISFKIAFHLRSPFSGTRPRRVSAALYIFENRRELSC